jgi:hypothetical protein
MITLDTLRKALLSGSPFDEIDRLVVTELSAGRSTRQVFDEMNPLVDRVLETPGLTEDGEEALWGTLDALTGDCHPDCQYKDPPQKSLSIES